MALSDEEIAKLTASRDEAVAAVAREVARLRDGIKAHRQASGHELCWLNDVELWKLVETDPAYPHDTLPVQEEFLSQCRRYHESRLKNTPYAEPATRTLVTKAK
jgi:hypothetical protein